MTSIASRAARPSELTECNLPESSPDERAAPSFSQLVDARPIHLAVPNSSARLALYFTLPTRYCVFTRH